MPFWKKAYIQLLALRYGLKWVTFDAVPVAGLWEEDGEPVDGRIIAEYVWGDPQVNHYWLTDGKVEPAGESSPGTPRYFIRDYTFAIEMQYGNLNLPGQVERWSRHVCRFETWGDVDLTKLHAALKQSRSKKPLSFADATRFAVA